MHKYLILPYLLGRRIEILGFWGVQGVEVDMCPLGLEKRGGGGGYLWWWRVGRCWTFSGLCRRQGRTMPEIESAAVRVVGGRHGRRPGDGGHGKCQLVGEFKSRIKCSAPIVWRNQDNTISSIKVANLSLSLYPCSAKAHQIFRRRIQQKHNFYHCSTTKIAEFIWGTPMHSK